MTSPPQAKHLQLGDLAEVGPRYRTKRTQGPVMMMVKEVTTMMMKKLARMMIDD